MRKSPKVNIDPRITVNELASYMLSTERGKLGILKRSKFPQLPPMIRYRDVRSYICTYLTDRGRNVNPLIDAEKLFEQKSEDTSLSSLMQDDAANSIDVLQGIQRMSNQLMSYDFFPAPKIQPKLSISGVQISIRADLLVEGIVKGNKHCGGAILRMTQANAETELAINKRKQMGLYVSTLMRMHVDAELHSELPIANNLCMSIDIRHGEAFTAPKNNTNRQKDIEAACLMIASYWPSITE